MRIPPSGKREWILLAILKAASTWSSGVLRWKWMLTGNCRASTEITGGGDGKSSRLPCICSTCSVADMMISLSGPGEWALAVPSQAPPTLSLPAAAARCARKRTTRERIPMSRS
eukprot:6204610-Pleurochrysis_carterae.AAC.1